MQLNTYLKLKHAELKELNFHTKTLTNVKCLIADRH